MGIERHIEEVFRAVQSDDAAGLRRIVEADPQLANTENKEGLTPLGVAAHYGNAGAVRVLLDCGAEVSALSHSAVDYIPSNTALHAAIAGKRDREVIDLLLAHDAPVDLCDSIGHTCLHTAAYHADDPELIRLLIEHGADVKATTKDGETAFSIANGRGRRDVADLLRRYGELQS